MCPGSQPWVNEALGERGPGCTSDSHQQHAQLTKRSLQFAYVTSKPTTQIGNATEKTIFIALLQILGANKRP